jgi:transcription antitermination protein NusB
VKVRTQARIVALQALFEIDCVGHDPQVVLEYRLEDSDLPSTGKAFVRVLVEGVLERIKPLDDLIAKYAPEWPVDQMAIIDRNILRIAIYEIATAENTPIKVAINEAVELAKVFGSGSSRRFVNGVLGSFVAEGGRLAWKSSRAGTPSDGQDSLPVKSEMG